MKRIIMMLISIVGILLVPSLPLVASASAASLVVEAKPNPGTTLQEITITIATADEGVKVLWGSCDLLVYFGDRTPAPNIGKLTSEPGGLLIKRTTHKYLRPGTYTIEVIPLSCTTSKANSVKTTVKINPIKAVIPGK
jgi:hypothetical protein